MPSSVFERNNFAKFFCFWGWKSWPLRFSDWNICDFYAFNFNSVNFTIVHLCSPYNPTIPHTYYLPLLPLTKSYVWAIKLLALAKLTTLNLNKLRTNGSRGKLWRKNEKEELFQLKKCQLLNQCPMDMYKLWSLKSLQKVWYVNPMNNVTVIYKI